MFFDLSFQLLDVVQHLGAKLEPNYAAYLRSSYKKQKERKFLVWFLHYDYPSSMVWKGQTDYVGKNVAKDLKLNKVYL